jgi:DNA gyrase subunit A
MGRTTRGVRGIRLREGDEVVSMQLIDPERQILAVTENGYGKRSPSDQYRITRRGGKGIVTILTTERNGLVVGSLQVGEEDQAMLVTDGGMMIRFRVSDVRTMGRYTQGVRLVRLRDGESVVAIERLGDIDDDDDDITTLEEGTVVDDELGIVPDESEDGEQGDDDLDDDDGEEQDDES